MPKGVVDVVIAFNTDVSGLMGARPALQRVGEAIAKLGTDGESLARSSENMALAFDKTDRIVKGRLLKTTFGLIDANRDLYGQINKVTQYVEGLNGVLVRYDRITERITHKKVGGIFTEITPQQFAQEGISPLTQTKEGSISSRLATLREIREIRGPGSFLDRALGGSAIDVAGLMRRALFTIPVWMALRNVMMATFSIIPDGIDRFRELDQAIADMKIQTSKFSLDEAKMSLEDFDKVAKESLTTLSRETGATLTELSQTYRVFSESGASVATSFSGMEVATKGAIGSLTDSKALAQYLIDAYRLFGNTITKASGEQDKLAYMMGVTNMLFINNTGSLKNYVDSFSTFSGVAKTWGLTFEETMVMIVSLTNAAQKGQANGTQLTRAFQEMIKNRTFFNDYIKSIQEKEPGTQKFAILTSVISKLSKELGNPRIGDTVTELFGSKSQKGVLGLAATFGKFQENLERLKDFNLAKALELNERQFQLKMNTVNQQLLRFKVITQDITANFLSGLFGTNRNSPAEVMKDINDGLIKSIGLAKALGETLNSALNNPLIRLLTMLALWRMLGFGQFFRKRAIDAGLAAETNLARVSQGIRLDRRVGYTSRKLANVGFDVQEAGFEMTKGIRYTPYGQMIQGKPGLVEGIIGPIITSFGAQIGKLSNFLGNGGLLGLSFGILMWNVLKLGKVIGTVATSIGSFIAFLPKLGPSILAGIGLLFRGKMSMTLLAPIIGNLFKGIFGFLGGASFGWALLINEIVRQIKVFKGPGGEKLNIWGWIKNSIFGPDKNAPKEVKIPFGPANEQTLAQMSPEELLRYTQTLMTPKEIGDLNKKILDMQSEELKTRGALTSEVLKQYDASAKLLRLEETTYEKLVRQLDIQKAINEEKKPKARLGTDTMKLYDIAIKGGANLDIAKYIGEYLQGTRDIISLFDEGTAVANVFKKNWADLFKQKQAEAFFMNDVRVLDTIGGRPRGATSFWGTDTGLQIPIEEEFIREGTRLKDVGGIFFDASMVFNDAVQTFKGLFHRDYGYEVSSEMEKWRAEGERMKDNPTKAELAITLKTDQSWHTEFGSKGTSPTLNNADIDYVLLRETALQIEGLIDGTGGDKIKQALDTYNYGKSKFINKSKFPWVKARLK